MKATILQLTWPLEAAGYNVGDTIDVLPTAVPMHPLSTWADGKWHASYNVALPGNGATCVVADGLHIQVEG